MKHSLKVTILLLCMFFVTQLIGLAVIGQYQPQQIEVKNENGTISNVTTYNLPYAMEPPEDVSPVSTILSIMIALVIAVVLMLILMKYKIELVLRIWFFVVVVLAIGVTLNAAIKNIIPNASLIVLILALPLAYLKIFKRHIIVHNLTELMVYPGVAAIFVPLLSFTEQGLSSGFFSSAYQVFNISAGTWSVIATVTLLILISIYDMYAVWRAKFMQKMAKYQIKKLKVFTGFFVPYLGKEQRAMIKEAKAKKKDIKGKKIKVNVAILGGGDVVFPMILAGVILNVLGLAQAIVIALGATVALAALFAYSQKGKFYPAMPFITAGCLVGLLIAYLI